MEINMEVKGLNINTRKMKAVSGCIRTVGMDEKGKRLCGVAYVRKKVVICTSLFTDRW